MDKKTGTWLELAEADIDFAGAILKNKMRAHYSVHFCHQAIEKLLKAIIQNRTGKMPLRTHNFKILCEQAGIELPDDNI